MSDTVFLVLVGLGNPEPAQQGHRHNIGFMVIDHIARQYRAPKFQAKHDGLVARMRIETKPVLLFKPQNYVNKSGDAIYKLARFYRLVAKQFVIVHDELDLPFGHTRIKQGGGLAGHNGLKSIAQHLGTDFWRIRLGIGHPGARELVTNYVLSNFAKSEQTRLTPWLTAIAQSLPDLLAGQASKMQIRLQEAMH